MNIKLDIFDWLKQFWYGFKAADLAFLMIQQTLQLMHQIQNYKQNEYVYDYFWILFANILDIIENFNVKLDVVN